MVQPRILFLKFFLLILFIFPTTLQADLKELRGALKKVEKNVFTTKLDNGLRVIMYNRGIAPVFTGVLAVRAGGVDEHLGNTGISHMLEHMAFKGTDRLGTKDSSREGKLLERLEKLFTKTPLMENFNEEQLKEWKEIYEELTKIWNTGELEQEYTKWGASNLNATTSKETTNYYVSLPRSAFEFWCWLESERVLNPVMRRFYEERNVVLEERRMRYVDSPAGKLYEKMLGIAFLGHPYRNPVIVNWL